MGKHRGRKRNSTVERQPNGQPRRTTSGPTAELIAKRSELVGSAWSDARAMTPIGQMELAGKITYRQAVAGQRMRQRWSQWAQMQDVPAADAPAIDGRQPGRTPALMTVDPDSEAAKALAQQAARCKAKVDELERAAKSVRYPPLAWAIIRSVCVDEVLPPRLLIGWHPEHRGEPWHQGWTVVRNALDAMADALGIPDEIAA